MPLVYDDSIDNVQNQPGTTLAVTASSTSSVYVTGSVIVSQSNFPAGAAVTISGQPIYINSTATLGVSQSNIPAGTQAMSQSNWPAGATTLIGGQPIYINTTATLGVSQSNTPAGTQATSQSNWPAGATVTVSGQPIYINTTATLAVSQSNTPAGVQAVSQSNWPAGATVTGTVGVWNTVAVSQSNVPVGTLVISTTASTTPTVTTQNPSLTGVALKAANASRKGLAIYNQTSQVLYVKMGTTATLADFTLIMDVSGYYESPFAYNGAYWGVQGATATGLVYVTEVT